MGANKPSGLRAELAAELASLKLSGRLRNVAARSGGVQAPVDFTSNDYLGLATHPLVVEAGRKAMAEHGAGGRAARLLGGGAGHSDLEAMAADWLDEEAALFFPSGYQANLGLLTSLARAGDVVFSAAANHASIIDGLRLAKARVVVFDHTDPADLESKLRANQNANRRIVAVEGIYSMDGDLAPLASIDGLCAKYDAYLVVDEAHAVGLVGQGNRGAAQALTTNPATRLVARTVTGGKALGAGGALVVGSQELIDILLNRSRSFIFTTASTPALAASLAAAIAVVQNEPELGGRAKMHAATLAAFLGLDAPDAAILSVVLGDEQVALDASEALWKRGFDVRAVRPPTVPVGSSRLRIVTHAFNTDDEVEKLAIALQQLGLEAQIQAPMRGERSPLAPTVVIAGTDTDVGKTVAASLVVRALKNAGSIRYWKPVQTGDDSDSKTVERLAGLDEHEVLRPAWELPLPASPHEAAAAAGVEINSSPIGEKLTEFRMAAPDSHIVVELAGGLLVPYSIKGRVDLQADWLKRLALPTVLVARSGLGTLNHTLLSLEAMHTRHLAPAMILLLGPPHASNGQTIRALAPNVPVIEVPILTSLDPGGLDNWLDSSSGCEFVRLLASL